MYITFDSETKKVIYIGEKKPLAVSGRALLGEAEDVPSDYDYLTVESSENKIRQITEIKIVRKEKTGETGEKYYENEKEKTVHDENYLSCVLKANFFERLSEKKIAANKEIAALKSKLSETDYRAIKYAEGLISEEEYANVKVQRQAWRDRINELEKD